MKSAPALAPNVPLVDGRPDLDGSETRCPVRERDGTRCTADAGMWTYGHICSRHSEQLRRGRKLILVNGTRLDELWSMPGRHGLWVKRVPEWPYYLPLPLLATACMACNREQGEPMCLTCARLEWAEEYASEGDDDDD